MPSVRHGILERNLAGLFVFSQSVPLRFGNVTWDNEWVLRVAAIRGILRGCGARQRLPNRSSVPREISVNLIFTWAFAGIVKLR